MIRKHFSRWRADNVATFKAKLGTGANAPVVDLGTERKSRADRKLTELRSIYPDAMLLDHDESPTAAAPVREVVEV